MYSHGVLKNLISLKKFIEITSLNPAGIFGFKNKGEIKEGMDADLVVWDPQAKEKISVNNHHQNCDLNIYEGFETIGKFYKTIVAGEIKWNAENKA